MKKLISDALKMSDKKSRQLSSQVRELLRDGNINGIADLVREKLAGKRKAPKAALKKLNDYFGDHSKFQYKTFRKAWGRIENVLHGHKSLSQRKRWIFINSSLNRYRL